MGALHDPVEEMLNVLEVEGGFDLPGDGNATIVGDPDFSWVTGATAATESYCTCVSHYMCTC